MIDKLINKVSGELLKHSFRANKKNSFTTILIPDKTISFDDMGVKCGLIIFQEGLTTVQLVSTKEEHLEIASIQIWAKFNPSVQKHILNKIKK